MPVFKIVVDVCDVHKKWVFIEAKSLRAAREAWENDNDSADGVLDDEVVSGDYHSDVVSIVKATPEETVAAREEAKLRRLGSP